MKKNKNLKSKINKENKKRVSKQMDKILIPSHRRLVPKNDLGFLNSLCIPTCTKKKKKTRSLLN